MCSVGLFLTSVSLSRNVWAVALTLGMLSGAGTGLAYASPMAMVAKVGDGVGHGSTIKIHSVKVWLLCGSYTCFMPEDFEFWVST